MKNHTYYAIVVLADDLEYDRRGFASLQNVLQEGVVSVVIRYREFD